MWLVARWLRLVLPAAWLLAAPAENAHAEPAPVPVSKPGDEQRKGAPREPDLPTGPPIAADQKRPVPNYDGRSAEPTDAGDVLIWVPRLVLSPLYLVSEYAVRRPLGWLVTTAERKKLPALLVDFFTFGPEKNAGIIPTGLVDFGFKPSVGLYFFWNEFLADNNKLRARAATWGEDWLRLSVANRTEILPGHELSLRAEYLERPDWVFYGIGPNTQNDDVGRFGSTQVDAGLGYDARLWRSSSVRAFVGFRTMSFQPSQRCCANPSVERRIAEGRYPEPVGLDDGYSVLREGVELALDTRRPREVPPQKSGDAPYIVPPGSGVRLDLRGEHAGSLAERRPLSNAPPTKYEWLRYGATVAGYVDVTGQQRVLGLSLIADFADPLLEDTHGGPTPIPFTELVSLGGDRPMRGYLHGRLRDRSAAVAVLEYQWPVWVWLDGTLNYSVGNVFGAHLDGFSAERLRSSFGLGVRSTSTRDHPFEILVAIGTKTFEEGSGVDHVRIVFGATNGF